jgi:hypothetical protein
MKFTKLIAIIAYAIIGTTTAVSAQEKNEKLYSVGPAIEFGGGGTSFGIQGKARVSEQVSVRPIILFGYKPISKNDLNQTALDAGATQSQIDTPASQAGLNTTLNSVGTGFAYGLAVTYDFKSPDNKFIGYVGPRMLIGSASGSNTTNGVVTNVSTSETNIGLTAGADYEITPEFTAGLNATYNFSRNASVAATTSGVKATAGTSAPTFNFGVNLGYNF